MVWALTAEAARMGVRYFMMASVGKDWRGREIVGRMMEKGLPESEKINRSWDNGGCIYSRLLPLPLPPQPVSSCPSTSAPLMKRRPGPLPAPPLICLFLRLRSFAVREGGRNKVLQVTPHGWTWQRAMPLEPSPAMAAGGETIHSPSTLTSSPRRQAITVANTQTAHCSWRRVPSVVGKTGGEATQCRRLCLRSSQTWGWSHFGAGKLQLPFPACPYSAKSPSQPLFQFTLPITRLGMPRCVPAWSA